MKRQKAIEQPFFMNKDNGLLETKDHYARIKNFDISGGLPNNNKDTKL
jgi:hypothetical protein